VYAECEGKPICPVSFSISREYPIFHLNIKTKGENSIEVSFQFSEEDMKQLISIMETEEIKYMYIDEEEREFVE
jgi:uncharacterized protein YkuJ